MHSLTAFAPSVSSLPLRHTYEHNTRSPLQNSLSQSYVISRRVRACIEPSVASNARSPRVLIEYCTGCRWGLRAGWMAQELLVTFEKELGEVALRPGTRSGVFDVWIDHERIWSREEMRRFPELKEIKQRVRDTIVPQRSLGHSDK